MNSVISGNPVYFHCTYGADRTGTVAYLLEALLGVPYENRAEDFELSTFWGMVPRNRYFSIEDGSNRNDPYKWVYMVNNLDTNDDGENSPQEIYNWFTDSGASTSDVTLVNQFRTAMINYN